MNIMHRTLGFGLVGLLLAASVRADWVDWNVNAAVPDNDETGLQDTRILSGYEGEVAALEVRLVLSAFSGSLAWNGDYYVTLQHASGFVVLLNRSGRTDTAPLGYGNNGFAVTFTLGGNDIHRYDMFSPTFDADDRLTGSWGVDGRTMDPDSVLDSSPRTDMLGSFLGGDANGTWTLFIADMNQNGEATLESWGVNVAVVPEPSVIAFLGLGALALFAIRRGSRRGRVLTFDK